MDNRRVLLAVLLSMIVIIGWQLLFPPPEPPAPLPGTPPVETTTADADGDRAGRAAGDVEAAGDLEEDAAEDGAPATEPTEDEVRVAEREETVVLVGEGFRAELSNRGGQLVSLVLPAHDDGTGDPVDLVRDRRQAAYPFGLVAPDGTPLPIDDELFVAEREGDTVVFRYAGPEGRATKRFAVEENGLLSVAVEADLDEPWAVALGPGLRNPSAIDEERKFKYRGVVYRDQGGVETVGAEKLEEDRELAGTGLSWVGVEDTYFLSVVVPATPVERVVVHPWLVRPGVNSPQASSPLI